MALPKRNKRTGRFTKGGRKKGAKKRKGEKKRKKGQRSGRYGAAKKRASASKRRAAKRAGKHTGKRKGRRFSQVCRDQFRSALKSGDKGYAMSELQNCDKAEKTIVKEKRLKALDKAREARKTKAAKRAEAKARKQHEAAIKRGTASRVPFWLNIPDTSAKKEAVKKAGGFGDIEIW